MKSWWQWFSMIQFDLIAHKKTRLTTVTSHKKTTISIILSVDEISYNQLFMQSDEWISQRVSKQLHHHGIVYVPIYGERDSLYRHDYCDL